MCGLLGKKSSIAIHIFPIGDSLTTITLHYYSDSDRGHPRLRFYAIPDDFNIWDAPSTSTPHVDVTAFPPDGEPAGHKNISINVNFNTRKVLMYKFSGSFILFAVSEMEFFICKVTSTCSMGIIIILLFCTPYDMRLLS